MQRLMVEYAAYFLDKIDSIDSWAAKDLKELKISKEAAKNVGLLGHSVGAGLATYVARKAADKGKPFKAVMYMAPQTQVTCWTSVH
jgi:acetyl esterase/lipase